MLIRVDLDGTLCTTEGTDYDHSRPRKDQIDKINQYYDAGHVIVIWTSRGFTRMHSREPTAQAECNRLHALTRNQLTFWGVKYHSIYFDKPLFDLLVDDKTLRIEELP